MCKDLGWLRRDVPLPSEIRKAGSRAPEEFGKLIPCECQAVDPLTLQRELRAASNLNDLEANFTLDKVLDRPGRHAGKAAALQVLLENGWLTLHGSYGSGKSYLGCAMVNEALRLGRNAVYWLMPLFLEELRRSFAPEAETQSSELYERALAAEVLVIDEFEKFYPTQWALERFQTLFLQRYRAYGQAVTVWITNVEPVIGGAATVAIPELEALFSRMGHFPIVHMSDGDIRPALARRNGAKESKS